MSQRTLERRYGIDLTDGEGQVCASLNKLIYFRRKDRQGRSP